MRRRQRVPLLCAFALLAACHGAAPEAIPTPRPPRIVVLDSGAKVRADLRHGRTVIGRVLVRTDSSSRVLVVARDGAPDAPPDTLSIDQLGALDVRGKSGGRWGLIGFYTGGLAGALIRKPDRTEDSGPMLLGML